MKYIDEFRDGDVAQRLAGRIAAELQPGRRYSFMEFCGGHTHALARYGVLDLLPPQVHMIHGPGCPVCVLPIGRIDQAIGLADGQRRRRRGGLEADGEEHHLALRVVARQRHRVGGRPDHADVGAAGLGLHQAQALGRARRR